MAKKKILMVCEAFGGGVFTYVSQLCNDMVDEFDIYLAYSLRPQTPKNYKDFLDQRVHLIEMQNVGVKGLTNLKSDIAAIKELRQIEKDVQPDVIHLHSSVAGGLGRLAYNGKNNTVVYTPHGYAHILMGPGKKSKVYKFAEKVLGNRALTLTCCESEDEEAKKFSKRTAHVETGVNLSDLSASLDGIKSVKNDKFTVFTLGRACVQKQPQLFNRIAELVPDARFIWIGNGELESELTAPNIEVTGWKPRKEALAMAKGADAFILCSLGEAIAMSLIENMYIKKLILVSNTMGNKSVINDGINGYVCDKAEEYAEHIKAAMKEFPKELAERAYQDVLEIYNTEAMKKKYIAILLGITLGMTTLVGCSGTNTSESSTIQESQSVTGATENSDKRVSEAETADVYGEVTAVSEDSITIKVGTMKQMEKPDGEGTPSMLDLTDEEKEIKITDDTVYAAEDRGKLTF